MHTQEDQEDQPMMDLSNDPAEIQDRLRKRYLDRLAQRLRKMRKDLVARNWTELKGDCRHLRNNVESFGFSELHELATRAETAIPAQNLSKAFIPPEAKRSLDALMTAMDKIISAHAFHRPEN